MIQWSSLLTIVLMAAVTYLTRIIGFLALRNRTPGKRAVTVMEAAPGCVLISV
ncbi:AzlD family protein, partial [Stenotrophomonas maltophilia]